MSPQGDTTDRIRSTVSTTTGAVLLSSPCLGRCDLASIAAVGRRDGPSGSVGPMVWFTGIEREDRFRALEAWIGDGGPQVLASPGQVLPSALDEATCGVSGPPTIHQH